MHQKLDFKPQETKKKKKKKRKVKTRTEVSRRKEVINIRAEINEVENKK